MSPPRVLLVEDDAPLRRFVAMALDDLDIVLIECASVAAAIEVLRDAPVRLILTDLMMPGESGLDLLRQLQDAPALQGPARVVVLSAGLTGEVRTQLAGFDVWRLLPKPVPVATLETCVREALAEPGAATAVAPPPGGTDAVAGVADAVREFFEGDMVLFEAYRSACMAQFPGDIHAGDAASAAADLPTLRRVAHSLKSVLLTLGYPDWSAQARELEESSHAGGLATAQAQWQGLCGQLRALLAGP